jgi:tetratricopeptide (TPR) repeat protein
MADLNAQLSWGRRATAAVLAMVTVVMVGSIGRTEAYQRTLAVNYLRWLVWVAPQGEAEAHTRLELAMARVTSEERRRGDLSAAIPDLESLTRHYPNSLAGYLAWDTMSAHYMSQGALDQAERCMHAVLAMRDSGRYDARGWHGQALLRLGMIEHRRGNLASAEHYLWRAAEHPERRDEAMRRLQMIAESRRQ